MDYLKKSRIEEVLIAILGKGTVTSQLISRIEKILDTIRVKGSYDGIVMSEVEEILVCILLGERFEKPTHSRIAAMLKVKANGGEYTELRKSRVEELIFEWIEGTSKIITYTGTLPATLQTVAGYLYKYEVYGNTERIGTPTPENPIMPSGCGVRTENLFDESTIEVGGLSPSTGVEIDNGTRRRSGFISVEPSTNYGLSREITSSGSHFWVIAYDESKNIVTDATTFETFSGVLIKGNELTDSQWTFATTPTTRYIRWYVTYNNSYKNIMLNTGSSPLPYEPYGYKLPILSNDTENDIYIGDTALGKDEYVDSETGKIYKWANITGLSEPLCGIGEYTDTLELSTGTLTKRIRKIELTGGENVTMPATSSFQIFGVIQWGSEVGVCSHYEQISWNDVSYANINGFAIRTNADRFRICDKRYTTVADFKAYLVAQYAAGTPVTIWYVLAEPEISTVPVPSGLTGTIEGYLIQDGTPTPESPIYPTANGAKQADGTYSIESVYLSPTDPPAPLPQIPTFAGETIVDYGIAALPHAAGLDGIFEYGDIDGQTWKNSVSGENDITFDTAVTDTGAEYVLPTGATGQYTSKSGEYRTAFTWYCIAKCPTTCHSAGQYMISNWNNQGVEISSGWADYSSAGVNHLVRSINNNDFNSAEAVTSYALIAVAGDVNGTASVYVNGVKMADSWNFNPVSSSGAAAVFLGKRASGQLSGTDIDYKFLALGTTKQTDEEIAANSLYLMTKYLGVGRPEKVELTYKTP